MVWEYFVEDKEKLDPEKSTKWVKCKVNDCQNGSIKMKNHNTSNLAYHLKQVHEISPGKNDETSEEMTDAKLEDFSKADQDLIDLKLYVHFLQDLVNFLILLELILLLPRIQRSLWWKVMSLSNLCISLIQSMVCRAAKSCVI